MTRHGAGPMERECSKEDINASIVDKTNIPNDWQNSLRFGYIDPTTLMRRVKGDFSRYNNATMNMVITQLNYTQGKIMTGKDTFFDLNGITGIDNLFVSDQQDIISKI